MKRFLILLLCIGMVQSAFSRNTDERMVDSLKMVIPNMAGEAKVNALNALSYALIQTNDYLEAKKYATEAFELSQQLTYPIGLADAHDNQGLVFQSKYDYTNAMKQFVEALKLRNQQGDQKGIATSKNNIGKVFF
ncbi:MAG: hypothetical protein AAF990_14105, partial [Bacteroidota bacterium]